MLVFTISMDLVNNGYNYIMVKLRIDYSFISLDERSQRLRLTIFYVMIL